MRSKNEVLEIARQIAIRPSERFPATDIIGTCRENGYSVFTVSLPRNIDGFGVSQDTPFSNFGTGKVIGVRADVLGVRRRLIVAREFSHCILHGRHMPDSTVFAAEAELEADIFAAELLMPEDKLKTVVGAAKQNGKDVARHVVAMFAVPLDFAQMWLDEQDL